MSKYSDWTLGQIEALINAVGGDAAARAVLSGERKLMVEQTARQQPTSKPPLVGTLVKTLHLKPNKVKSIKDAIKLGKYEDHDAKIVVAFAADEVGLTESVNVDLYQFDRHPIYEEILVWANGKKPILPKHIYAIGIQHPDEQRNAPIVAFGSVRHGYALGLSGGSRWRYLRPLSVQGYWDRRCLFGFLRE